MIKIEFTKETIEALNYERYHHPRPRVQRKAEALWLKNQGFSHQKVAQLTDISVNTLTNYLQEYADGGIDKLKEDRCYRPKSELVKHTKTIEDYFREHPPASIKEAMSKIEEIVGVKRSETRVCKFLKSIGIKRRKVGMVPGMSKCRGTGSV
ncbi:MAG: helix-turn-helix domain-containing protein [bacterium]|nr:helix-turn-helix domain-containing protein [bacterium]